MSLRKKGLLWLAVGLIGITATLAGVGIEKIIPASNDTITEEPQVNRNSNDSYSGVILTAQARRHILYGDRRGGGHFHTADKPCKSEFPAFWSEDRIIKAIKRIAANDNLPWRRESNGYQVVEQTSGTIIVRVVKSGNRVITGYPTNTERNPCPGAPPANDNFNE